MNRSQRAAQLWSLLALAATNRQVLTYNLVHRLTGMAQPGIGDTLRPIQQYCTENNLPPLTVLVVSEQTGLPGEGFIAAEDIPMALVNVFEHDWVAGGAPSEDELEQAYDRAPDRR